MHLYSSNIGMSSHTCRIVMFEKEVECFIHYLNTNTDPGDLGEHNPYNEAPTLVDRDLVIYDGPLICEYLDERLPHPPLMPVDPVSRARARLMMFRVRRDWINRISVTPDGTFELTDAVRNIIGDGLTGLSPIFREQQYCMGDDYTMVDCVIAPLLWRLPTLGIKLPPTAAPIVDYAKRLFDRTQFQISMSDQERELKSLV